MKLNNFLNRTVPQIFQTPLKQRKLITEQYGKISISMAHTSAFKYPRKISWLFSFIADFAEHYHYYKNMHCFSNTSKPTNQKQNNYKLTVDATTTHFQNETSNIIRQLCTKCECYVPLTKSLILMRQTILEFANSFLISVFALE